MLGIHRRIEKKNKEVPARMARNSERFGPWSRVRESSRHANRRKLYQNKANRAPAESTLASKRAPEIVESFVRRR